MTEIPGIGKTIAANLARIGVFSVIDFKDANPEELYEKWCQVAKTPSDTDKCVLYVFREAVYYANGGRDPEKLKWWNWKAETINAKKAKKTTVTLLFLIRNDDILLAMKKRRFGAGKWNGVGGKLEQGESVEQAMIREAQEEIGVTPRVYEQFGTIIFNEFVKGEREHIIMHVYKCTDWDGEPTESEEMAPRWFNKNSIPFDEMFPDDKYWFPLFLSGKKFTAEFDFDENWVMKSHKIEEVK